MEQQFYWHIELYSGEIIKVKPEPEKVALIQKMIAQQTGAITTPTRSIIIKDVKDFRLSDELYTDQKLLESSAQAFKEPIYTTVETNGRTYEAIKARWVKKSVPRRKWESYYSKIPSYKLLDENDSFVVITFVQAVHDIDHTRVQELTPAEELSMSNRVDNF